MKFHFSIFAAVMLGLSVGVSAQEKKMYKCQGEYTNTLSEAQARKRNCKPFAGGNLTVVRAQKPTTTAVRPSSADVPSGQRIDPNEQRTKDSDARLILESELKKAQARHAELLKEFNNGEPEKMGAEARNYQKYLDRVEALKGSIARNESDMASIRRELDRIPTATPR